MKKLFLFTMMCLFGLFSLNAQTRAEVDPVKWVKAVENGASVDVSWNMNFMTSEFEDFEQGSLALRDWKNSEEYPWAITETAYEGNFAIKSTCEGVDKSVSAIELTYEVPSDGFVGFYHKVSSEAGYDLGNFYIDDVLESSISGNKDWSYTEFFVTAGSHVYKWEYAKDSLTNTGHDAYFIDNITFHSEFNGGWIYYDNGEYATSIGLGTASPCWWGVKFPATSVYQGYSLTKIAVYDLGQNTNVGYTANIYAGGDNAPGQLIYTQDYTLPGTEEGMVEIELTEPVVIDATQSLWITLYCDELEYPVYACPFTGNSNSNWISLDGNEWLHISDYSFDNSWIIRGLLENTEGKSVLMTSNGHYPTFEGGASTGKFLAKAETSPKYFGTPATQTSALRNATFTSKYNVYRKNLHVTGTTTLAQETSETSYTDNETLGAGAYQYGVAALYDNNGTVESDIVWSNVISKDMFTTVTVTVATDNGDPISGTEINFVNLTEEKYNYSAVLGQSNTFTFDNFRKGSYKVTVSKKGFNSNYNETEVSVWEATTFECNLEESLDAVKDLYVSPTGYVMWDGAMIGAGEEFSFDFEDGTLAGWKAIDADGDGYSWDNSILLFQPGAGYNGSQLFATSASYFNGIGALNPDNYLVTEKKYEVGKTSQLRFYVCAQDANYSAEHYGVAISLAGNTSAADFTTIWEETLTAKSGNADAKRGTRASGSWYEKVVDLSDYAGQSIYIAIRHFNCTDQYFLNVDDVTLENADRASRALTAYKVYLNGELLTSNLDVPNYQHEDLVVGQEYTTTVKAVYTKGEGPATDYTWKYLGCENYEGVSDFKAEIVDGVTTVSWTLPENEAKGATREGTWFTYDNGENVDALGISYDGGVTYSPLQWGVMFPASDVAECAGQYLTKVKVYDHSAFEGELSICVGGSTAPGTAVYTQNIEFVGSKSYKEVKLSTPVEITGNDNVWVVLDNKGNGQFVASFCSDLNGSSNGRMVNMNNGLGWFDIQMFYGTEYYGAFQIHAFVTGDVSGTVTIPEAEVLGVNLYRNGELVSKLAQGESFVDKKAAEGDEYSLRVVYGGEKDLTYYAMSCPQTTEVVYNMPCKAPQKLHAESVLNADGTFGALLSYPYVPATSEWLYYDDGEFVNSIGGVTSYYWGIMFPVESLLSYAGTNITKVSFYDYAPQSGTINIYYGGETAPEVLVHSQPFTASGTQSFVEYDLTYPLPIDGDMNIWVVLGTSNGDSYPSAQASDVNNPNARWLSMDGVVWEDAADYDLYGTWMIRAYATNEAKGTSMPLETVEFVNTATGGTPMMNPNPMRTPTLKNYNIYRGTSLNNIEFVTETKDRTYFDEIEKGTYYYQVTAVYEENGETCESAFATSYTDPTKDYVVVEVTSINENGVNGVMIYPNPTKGDLNINVEAMTRITIVNTMGQVVYDRAANSDNEVINMAQFKAGVYMVRIATENGVATKRISVVR